MLQTYYFFIYIRKNKNVTNKHANNKQINKQKINNGYVEVNR